VIGGRGGYAGTVLAVALLCMVQTTIVVAGGPPWLPMILFATAILVGTCVSRALEALAAAGSSRGGGQGIGLPGAGPGAG
jgi:ribose/xylose/arabinose/galactoside ABC-type transport system permease subunit